MLKKFILSVLIVFLVGLLIPENPTIPVKDATSNDWNKQSFWYYPWGRSGVHKGIDIFAKQDQPVLAATQGLVIYTGYDSMGGNIVLMLGAKWRWHYYAHLNEINAKPFQWLSSGEKVGAVGTTGNAKGKSPHLHYTVKSIFPRFWMWDSSVRSPSQRMFFMDPVKFLESS